MLRVNESIALGLVKPCSTVNLAELVIKRINAFNEDRSKRLTQVIHEFESIDLVDKDKDYYDLYNATDKMTDASQEALESIDSYFNILSELADKVFQTTLK